MKKAILLSVTLAVITLAAVFVFTHTYSAKDKLLKENVAALATNPAKDGAYYEIYVNGQPTGRICCGEGNVRDCGEEAGVPKC